MSGRMSGIVEPPLPIGGLDDLLQLIRDLGHAGLAARLFLRPAIRRPAQADAADRLVADFDRNAALKRNDLGKRPLARNVGLGTLGPFEGRPPESLRRIGLAAGELDV